MLSIKEIFILDLFQKSLLIFRTSFLWILGTLAILASKLWETIQMMKDKKHELESERQGFFPVNLSSI